MASLGDNVRAERSRLRLSQEQLGQRAGLHKDTISAVERTHTGNLETIEKIASALRVSIATLIGEEDSRHGAD